MDNQFVGEVYTTTVGIELLVIANTNLFSLNKTSLVCSNFELQFLSGIGCLKFIFWHKNDWKAYTGMYFAQHFLKTNPFWLSKILKRIKQYSEENFKRMNNDNYKLLTVSKIHIAKYKLKTQHSNMDSKAIEVRSGA